MRSIVCENLLDRKMKLPESVLDNPTDKLLSKLNITRKVTQQKLPEYTTKTSSQVSMIYDPQSESSTGLTGVTLNIFIF